MLIRHEPVVPKILKLELDIDFDDDLDVDELKNVISNVIIENESEFKPITTALCTQTDIRASYIDESFEVESVEFNTSNAYDSEGFIIDRLSGSVSVNFEFFAYYGCKDIDGGDVISDVWDFELNNQKIKFNLVIPEERYDEI